MFRPLTFLINEEQLKRAEERRKQLYIFYIVALITNRRNCYKERIFRIFFGGDPFRDLGSTTNTPTMTRNSWTDIENAKYMAAYEEAIKLGLEEREKFEFISSNLTRRSPQVCLGHWQNALDPERSTGPWTAADDKLLADNVVQIGTSWTEIAKSFKGRTANMCKNRYYGEARKSERKERSRSRSRSRILPERTSSKKGKSKSSEESTLLQSSLAVSTESPFSIFSPLALTLHTVQSQSTDQTLAAFAFSSPSIIMAPSSSFEILPLDVSDDESLGDTSWLTQI